jgi:hypothetical protein
MVFGDALIEAYRLESTIAQYPRIILTEDIIEDVMAAEERRHIFEHVKMDDDCKFFLDILLDVRMKFDMLPKQAIRNQYTDHVFLHSDNIRRAVQQRLDESISVPEHFKKTRWFANYWNRSFAEDREGFKLITGPNLSGRRYPGSRFWDFFWAQW